MKIEFLSSMGKYLAKPGMVMKSLHRFLEASLTADRARLLCGLILLGEIVLLLRKFIICSWNIQDVLMYTLMVLLLPLLR